MKFVIKEASNHWEMSENERSNEPKPCPFCGNEMTGYPNCIISFKRDKRKMFGVYHEICTIKCKKCGCSISQAGASREKAEEHAANLWNTRADRSE